MQTNDGLRLIIGIILIFCGGLFIFLTIKNRKAEKAIEDHCNNKSGNYLAGGVVYEYKSVPLLLQIIINRQEIGVGFGVLLVAYGVDLIFLR